MRRRAVGQRSETVRRSNLSAIVRELHLGGPASRSELVARSGLTRSAIRGLIGELVAADLVIEERAELQGTPGRPSPVVRLDPTAPSSWPSRSRSTPSRRRSSAWAARCSSGSASTGPPAIPGSTVSPPTSPGWRPASSLGAPPARSRSASASPSSGSSAAATASSRWRPTSAGATSPLGDALTAALGLDVPISVANEADLGALVEFRRGAAVGYDDVLFISGEYGVGGGIIVDGRPLTGAAGYGGEVGHMPVNPTGTTCRCGSVGCWETEVGESALLRMAGRPPGGGPPGGRRDAARSGGRGAGRPERAGPGGRWLGIGLAGLVNIFNPRLIVLGGIFGRTLSLVGPTIEPNWIDAPWPLRAGSFASCRPCSARRRRCSAPPSSPSSRSWPTRPAGCPHDGPGSSWRRRDGSQPERSHGGSDRVTRPAYDTFETEGW